MDMSHAVRSLVSLTRIRGKVTLHPLLDQNEFDALMDVQLRAGKGRKARPSRAKGAVKGMKAANQAQLRQQ